MKKMIIANEKNVKKAFDGGYILYESIGDTYGRLSINEYFNISLI